ncbi:unnamed protein product [Lampetra fluviatilis]
MSTARGTRRTAVPGDAPFSRAPAARRPVLEAAAAAAPRRRRVGVHRDARCPFRGRRVDLCGGHTQAKRSASSLLPAVASESMPPCLYLARPAAPTPLDSTGRGERRPPPPPPTQMEERLPAEKERCEGGQHRSLASMATGRAVTAWRARQTNRSEWRGREGIAHGSVCPRAAAMPPSGKRSQGVCVLHREQWLFTLTAAFAHLVLNGISPPQVKRRNHCSPDSLRLNSGAERVMLLPDARWALEKWRAHWTMIPVV